jgi:hypothetical protein
MKKSFLAEQEKEKLYDIHKAERGTYMSEKVDLNDPAKAVHYLDEGQETEIVDFTMLTNQLELASPEIQHDMAEQIKVLENQLDEIDDDEIKEMNKYQIEIFKQHQDDMP